MNAMGKIVHVTLLTCTVMGMSFSSLSLSFPPKTNGAFPSQPYQVNILITFYQRTPFLGNNGFSFAHLKMENTRQDDFNRVMIPHTTSR